jgi:hypothetical protein
MHRIALNPQDDNRNTLSDVNPFIRPSRQYEHLFSFASSVRREQLMGSVLAKISIRCAKPELLARDSDNWLTAKHLDENAGRIYGPTSNELTKLCEESSPRPSSTERGWHGFRLSIGRLPEKKCSTGTTDRALLPKQTYRFSRKQTYLLAADLIPSKRRTKRFAEDFRVRVLKIALVDSEGMFFGSAG